jgi:hypothetical protein
VLLEALTEAQWPTARLLVVDPHGEYGTVVPDRSRIIRTGLDVATDPDRLRVPFWALPFDELFGMTMGELQPGTAEAIRDQVREMKIRAAGHLPAPPPPQTITADSPVPFSIRQLWWDLVDFEQATYQKSSPQDDSTRCTRESDGDPTTLEPPRYPAPTHLNTPPYRNQRRRNIGRQLDLLRMRLLDKRFAFMFDADDPLHPDLSGQIEGDLSDVVAEWVGGEKAITVVDVSGLPPDVIGTVVGTMLGIIYATLFWAADLPVGGRHQPLLVMVDEAHRFLPEGIDTPAHRVFSTIAKEGRKYGVGLMVVTQRPSDIDASVLSQAGTMIALRVTNPADRHAVASTVPDDLGGLVALLPSLRTGEGLVLGDALQVPSRVRIARARRKPVGDDAPLPGAWQGEGRPDRAIYAKAVANWRSQTTSAAPPNNSEES